MVVHLGIGQVALFLAAGDQQLQLRLAILGHARGTGREGLLVLLRQQLRGGLGIEGRGRRAVRLAGADAALLGAGAGGATGAAALRSFSGNRRGAAPCGRCPRFRCVGAGFLGGTTALAGFFSG